MYKATIFFWKTFQLIGVNQAVASVFPSHEGLSQLPSGLMYKATISFLKSFQLIGIEQSWCWLEKGYPNG